ncbi:8828_t:CDS:1, partial [Gigaspora rosea]
KNVIASLQLLVINNPPKSRRPKKGRVGCQKEKKNTPVAENKHVLTKKRAHPKIKAKITV